MPANTQVDTVHGQVRQEFQLRTLRGCESEQFQAECESGPRVARNRRNGNTRVDTSANTGDQSQPKCGFITLVVDTKNVRANGDGGSNHNH